MKTIKKVFKISGIVLLLLIVGVYVLFVSMTAPKSDEKVIQRFNEAPIKPILAYKTYKNFSYRVLSVISDRNLPTIIFVHGTIGSCLDFSRYMMDEDLIKNYNMISYDRIGYNYNDQNSVQESIAFERDLLDDLIAQTASNSIILTGYSYGGPIALASHKKITNLVLLAPAVYSKVEPMPWMLNFYKWGLTRWLVPDIWKEASKEKMSHQQDLINFENNWEINQNTIISIHGDADWIVPYSNSEYLLHHFPKERFQLITLKDAGHDLIWSQFSQIKQQLLNL
ncbi:Pimeloyl-ACP methyl ester carboxylesterase [Tenacibaculum sp. MAR_2009_124]|uniref:alpha/beta fold hydrolase n=1 Tax=Tenacibaculum sp. MAR_2009_124 TaxID=1250059 RepID=UPI000894BA97|nr:alpha/beta hydrolase [Tenacibaculum sp. MAR_2009_124]SEB83716.1 Pimeloyl-ACP methyl ester carboxylesterase [Tenacibaculum sp. MAR_2009_124]